MKLDNIVKGTIYMDYQALAELLYPNLQHDCDYYEKLYPERDLPEGARVTRFAPSPTGYLHLGGVYQVMCDERLAHRSNGVFMLRIEDTDSKRELADGIRVICDGVAKFGIKIDEGVGIDGETGKYGPYIQSRRAEIYHTFAKKLVAEGKAYPCFCSAERLEAMRAEQEAAKVNPGYYGKYAVCRELSYEEVKAHLDNGDKFVLRFKACPTGERPNFTDCVRGRIDVPENDIDMVIIKSDGIPVYHFAHVVDDHLMRTTHVVRGEEWLATLPLHVQLFEAFGWKRPEYIHTATIMKLDNGGKRKLSKRKDPEAAVEYFFTEGYPKEALIDYLLMLLNSNYEEWRAENPDASYEEFPYAVEKMSNSGCLFDFSKLYDISKNVISRMNAEEAYASSILWSEKYDEAWHTLFTADPEKAVAILSIGRGGEKPRKDIGTWKELPAYAGFFFDETFAPDYAPLAGFDKDDVKKVFETYPSLWDAEDDQQTWFNRIKELAVSMGYAPDTKTWKKNKESYKGHAGDISMMLRVAVTGRTNSPDLCEVMKTLGAEKVKERLDKAAAAL